MPVGAWCWSRLLTIIWLAVLIATPAASQVTGALREAVEIAGRNTEKAAAKGATAAATTAAKIGSLSVAQRAAIALGLVAGATSPIVYLKVNADDGFEMFFHSATGIERQAAGTVDDAIRVAGAGPDVRVVIDPQIPDAKVHQLATQLNGRDPWTMASGQKLSPMKFRKTVDGLRPTVVIDEGLEIVLKEADMESVLGMLSREINTSKLRVKSLFDEGDVDVIKRFDEAVGERHSALVLAKLPTEADIIASLINGPGKLVIAIGHIEGDHIVVRNSLNEVRARVNIQMLQKQAQEQGVTVFVLGCESAAVASGGGFVLPISDQWLSAKLKGASNAKNAQAFLSALGERDAPIVVTPTLASDVALGLKIVIPERKVGGNVLAPAVIGHALLSPRQLTIAQRAISGSALLLLLGIFGSLFLTPVLADIRNQWFDRIASSVREGGPLVNSMWQIAFALLFLAPLPLMVILSFAAVALISLTTFRIPTAFKSAGALATVISLGICTLSSHIFRFLHDRSRPVLVVGSVVWITLVLCLLWLPLSIWMGGDS